MSERPYICETGHELANGVTTCPRCGTRAKPVRRDLSFYAGVALLVVAIVGGGATLLGRDGGSDSRSAAGGDSSGETDPAPVWTEDSTTTTVEPTSTTASTTTTAAPTSTAPAPGEPATGPSESAATTVPAGDRGAPPGSEHGTPATTTPDRPTTTHAPRPPTPRPSTPPPPAPKPPTTAPRPAPPSGVAKQQVARDAAAVAFTSGHSPAGHPSMTSVIAPALRPHLDVLTRRAGYRRAGCTQRVTRVIAGPVDGDNFEFTVNLTHTCARPPVENGFRLPLISSAYAVFTVGPKGGDSVWATSLSTR